MSDSALVSIYSFPCYFCLLNPRESLPPGATTFSITLERALTAHNQTLRLNRLNFYHLRPLLEVCVSRYGGASSLKQRLVGSYSYKCLQDSPLSSLRLPPTQISLSAVSFPSPTFPGFSLPRTFRFPGFSFPRTFRFSDFPLPGPPPSRLPILISLPLPGFPYCPYKPSSFHDSCVTRLVPPES